MRYHPRFGALLGTALLASTFAIAASAQTASVGIYTDTSGSSCSFSGNDAGFVYAYVVMRPGAEGLRAVRFAAPLPACFGAFFVSDEVPFGMLSAGGSQTGISISTPDCHQGPLHVLTMTYYRAGSTSACCPYPIIPEGGFASPEGVNCAGADISIAGLTSHFNADATCACSVGEPPNAPSNPVPADGATLVSRTDPLSWFASDYDSDLADFDVYLGTTNPPSLVAAHVTEMTYQPAATLDPLTPYYWRVVARDQAGRETSGPTWDFITRPLNSPPTKPEAVNPGVGDVLTTAGISTSTLLQWDSFDLDGDALTYDLYLGNTTPPPFLKSTFFRTSGSGSLALETTYYWQVVVHDAFGHTVSSDIWHFSTHQVKIITDAIIPNPPSGQTAVPVDVTLRWGDPNQQGTFEVYFGGYDPNKVPTAIVHTPAYKPANGFQANHEYIWYIIGHVGTTTYYTLPEWSFYTGTPQPNTPANPSPAYDSIAPVSPTLQWLIANPNGETLTYQVRFWAADRPSITVPTSQPSFAPGALDSEHRYYWQVTSLGSQYAVNGPIWTFTTDTGVLPPSVPSVASNPYPPDNGYGGVRPTLSWSASDPNGAPLTFTVNFGTTDPPPFYGLSSASTYQIAGPVSADVRCYWQVVANNGHNSTPGPVWSFIAVENPLPVLFSRFDATSRDDGIEVTWELKSDEGMESYTLYRREGITDSPAAIAEGRVDGVRDSYLDRTAVPGETYRYELAVRTTDGDVFRSQTATASRAPTVLALHQNRPNPFNPQTTIRYDLPGGAGRMHVRLVIVDVAGRMVRRLVDEEQAGGSREVTWQGTDDRGQAVSSGVYFYVLDAGGKRLTRKLVLLK